MSLLNCIGVSVLLPGGQRIFEVHSCIGDLVTLGEHFALHDGPVRRSRHRLLELFPCRVRMVTKYTFNRAASLENFSFTLESNRFCRFFIEVARAFDPASEFFLLFVQKFGEVS